MTTADEILARRDRYTDGDSTWWWDTRRPWDDHARTELRILAESGVDITKAANALGRSDTSLAWRCKTDKVKLPPAWSKLIRPVYKPRPRWTPLVYPYINFRRAETETLLAVNEMVPRQLPGREDVCQSIMLTILERGLTPDRATVNEFIRKFRRENYENDGYALSLDATMYDWDRTIGDSLVGLNSFEYWI